MIEFVVGRRVDICDVLYDQLLQYRHEIFVRRLGWHLPKHVPKLAREEDEFDTPHTVYLAAVRGGHVCGCARLLPTTRPYLLEHVFPDLLDGRPLPRAPGVWELSRFAAGSTRSVSRSDDGSLARAIFQLALFTGHVLGAESLIGVTSARVERFCTRNGFRILPLGARKPCADAEVGAFAIRITRACEAETRAVLGARPVRWLLTSAARRRVSVQRRSQDAHTSSTSNGDALDRRSGGICGTDGQRCARAEHQLARLDGKALQRLAHPGVDDHGASRQLSHRSHQSVAHRFGLGS